MLELVHIDMWSDFVCPWSYLVSSCFEQLKQSHPITIQWHAYELIPKGSPPISTEVQLLLNEDRPRLYQIARDDYGLKLNAGHFNTNSRLALIGAKIAAEQGLGDAYNGAILHAFWHEAQPIDQVDILRDAAESIGLDGADFVAALSIPAYEEQVEVDIQAAWTYGISGIPALIIEKESLIMGVQTYETLVQVIENTHR